LVTKVFDFAKTETCAKIVAKGITFVAAVYLNKTITPEQLALILAGYLAVSAAIDGWWHKSHPQIN